MGEACTELKERSGVISRYLGLTGILLLVNDALFLGTAPISNFVAALWSGAVWLTGSLLLLGVAFLPVLAAHQLQRLTGEAFARRVRTPIVYALAVLAGTAAQGFLLLDRHVYGIYGFHFNGFVWNLITTKGGVDSMAAGTSTRVTFALYALLLAAVQAALLGAVIRWPRLRGMAAGKLTRRRVLIGLSSFLIVLLAEKITYAYSVFRSYGPVLTASNAFPLYIPVTFSDFLRKIGFKDDRDSVLRISGGSSRLNYPLRAPAVDPARKPPNVVWLVSESLRADMLDPDIMPATWAFSERSLRFEHHYSGGNGTRMGMFSMFYGLPGNYWSPCLAEVRGPVLMDRIVDAGYQLQLFTSAEFSFPELDKTVFARVPRELLCEATQKTRWARDRENVARIIEEIDRRDPSRPFFTFMFFESPHSPYNFPDECIIRRPFVREVNYLTMDLKKDIGTLKNSYINACRHLDTQLERIFKHLEEKGLLDSTVVVVTGDHGEEFMEKGRWGHHSDFSEEQTLVPLVLHVPGVAPARVARMSSHLDLPATILPLLGVTNPPGDYSLGASLLDGPPREFAVVSGWSEIAYVDDAYKSVFPLKSYDVVHRGVTTRDDAPADRDAFMAARRDRLTKLIKDLRRFQK